jgi:hypothetical protein
VIRSKCFFLPSLIFLILLCRCANPVTPEGGPKDVTPPKVIKSDPPVASTNFHNRDIRITFDEFIQLKDQNNQINIAPPLLPHTDIRLRGKSIIIDLKESLKANTTYSINFGNSIADLTENNVLKDFIYTFSTGTYIDSLTLSGRILSAFDLTPQKDVVAMLYINENDTLPLDSLPYHVKPYYIAKADEKGEFTFRNLRDVPFLLFALKDLNGDYIFNPPGEKVAFCDSLVRGIYIKPAAPELLRKDSVINQDTLPTKKDTSVRKKEMAPMFTLLLFEESDSIQKILKADMVSPGQVGIIYRFPAVKPGFLPLNLPDSAGWMIPEFNAGKDSVYLWVRNVMKDSLILRLSDKDRIIDTARINLLKKNSKKSKGEKGAVVLPKLQISSNMPSSRLNQFTSDPLIISAYPLAGQDLSRIRLIDGKDTVRPKVVFADAVNRKLKVSYKWQEERLYKLIIPDSIFHAINGQSNDSVLIPFKTYSVRDFGSIEMEITLDNPSGNYIVQLLSEKENVLDQRNITSSGKVKFEYLFPAKYKIKVIFDHNSNRRWDTGNYSKKLQPEKVQYFDKIIEVRANWDISESWKL